MVMRLTWYLSCQSMRLVRLPCNALRRYGVNTDFIARGGDRVGLYYAEGLVLLCAHQR